MCSPEILQAGAVRGLTIITITKHSRHTPVVQITGPLSTAGLEKDPGQLEIRKQTGRKPNPGV